MKPLVSVITPTIPSRADLLEECRASVAAQTTKLAFEHVVLLDEHSEGNAKTMNKLAAKARGEWLLPLADDDLLLPGCLDTLLARREHGEIIYSPPLVWGNGELHFFGDPPHIPSFALMRASLWRELGGYDEELHREEDRNMWVKALNSGARFVRVDLAPTWVYRFHMKGSAHQNKSYHGGLST